MLSALLSLVLLLGACGSGSGSDRSAAPDDTPDDLGFSDDESTADNDGEPVVIEWFVGLGTGSREEQLDVQRQVVAEFNEAHPDIDLQVEFVTNEVAFDVLVQRLAEGDAPDIVGPLGIKGANAFQSHFLDIEPLIEKTGFDLSAYDPEQVEVWRDGEGNLTALPFGVFPAMLYVNTTMFEEAGLPLPPQSFGETYEGKEWNTDALYDLAVRMTRDADGNDPTNPDFNPDETVQFGFDIQWMDDPRALGTMFGPGNLVVDGKANIPDQWLEAWSWYHRLIWDDHAAPSGPEVDSELLGQRNGFNSGRVAMALSHLWYTSSLQDAEGNPQSFFDLAVVPSHNGRSTSNLHADTFRIMSDTEHPDEAFTVLSYLIGSETLLAHYGSFPARRDLQAGFLAELEASFPQDVTWSVVSESLAHPDVPSHEADTPDYIATEDRMIELRSELNSNPDLDVEAEAEVLRKDLDVIFAADDVEPPPSDN